MNDHDGFANLPTPSAPPSDWGVPPMPTGHEVLRDRNGEPSEPHNEGEPAPIASSGGGKGGPVKAQPFERTAITLEWVRDAPPPRKWLMEYCPPKRGQDAQEPQGWLLRGTVGLVTATGGTGKTRALMQLACSVATGSAWLRVFQPVRPGKVLFCLGEEDAENVRHRFFQAATQTLDDQLDAYRQREVTQNGQRKRVADYDVEAERKRLHELLVANCSLLCMRGQAVALVDEGGERAIPYERLQATLREWGGVSLVILDPSSRFQGAGSETDNAVATAYVEALESLAMDGESGRPTVLVSHHTRKPSTEKTGGVDLHDQHEARGSSALVDGVRWGIALRTRPHDHTRIYLGQTKVNDVKWMPTAVELKHDANGLVFQREITNGELNNELVAEKRTRDTKLPSNDDTKPSAPPAPRVKPNANKHRRLNQ